MAEATQLKVAPPLPATRTDLLAGYKLKRRRSINDLVEEIVVKLWDNDEQFMKYVDAIYNEQAVEGSLDDDDTMAAIIIRDTAKRDKHMEVAAQNIRTISTAPWLLLWPGGAVVLAVLSFNFLGDGMRDAADPYET